MKLVDSIIVMLACLNLINISCHNLWPTLHQINQISKKIMNVLARLGRAKRIISGLINRIHPRELK